MRLLLIHADYLEFEAIQPTPAAEEVGEDRKSGRIEEALVAFTAVEEDDERDQANVVSKALKEILDYCERVRVRKVAVYPYAHLSPNLSSPTAAIKILKDLRERLSKEGLEVLHVPFGWYKSFTLRCKGHPLSELSRTITAEPEITRVEEEKPSEFIVINPEGEEEKLDLRDLDSCEAIRSDPLMKQFILSEELKHKPRAEPAHIKLMRRLELVDYEPSSDIGHFRFYPKGAMMKSLLEDFALQLAREIGAIIIETPLLYRVDEPDIREQASKFLAKDYRVKIPGRTLLLRFAGDFGLFRMMKETHVSYKQMPIRVFELSPSFRLEQSGECVGLKRLRAFTMPDLHCFCLDLSQGLEEYDRLFHLFLRPFELMGIPYVIVFRVVKEFYDKHRDFIGGLLRKVRKPALVELLPERKHYWVMKHELQILDSTGGNSQLATVQLDLEDSERYGISYVDENGKKRGCIILHSSMGSIERWMYALLENAEKLKKAGRSPSLPLWLSPTQVRLIPVSDRHLKLCIQHSEELERYGVRVDIDDRNETVAKRIRYAEREWIPYVVVIGDEEEKSRRLPVRVRELGKLVSLEIGELGEEIRKKCEGTPRAPLPLPKLLSMRPIFVG